MADDDGKRGKPAGTQVTRREFLQELGSGVAIGGLAPLAGEAASARLPDPARSGIEHIVVVMMENRSFDHYLGWLPGADGQQAGLTYPDRAGVPQPTHALAPEYQGCADADPDHSYEGGRIEYNNGACDGWLRAGANDEYSIGYYTRSDLSFFGQAAPYWTTCDRYFPSILGPTLPNRIYQHAGQTDRIDNRLELSTLPTIWDRLAERGLRGLYYYSDIPVLALWGFKYVPIGRPFFAFLLDCFFGTLPHVSFVEPRFLGADAGVSNDDHPHADIRNGQAFMNLVYTAVALSPAWRNTVLIFNYDEWGGFFDHVPPPTAVIPEADKAAGNQDGRLGFRVPCMIASPFARRRFVSSTVFEHTSVLRLIEWRWGLEPLTERDATAANFADVLDFDQRIRRPRLYQVPPGPFGAVCPPSADSMLNSTTAPNDTWAQMHDVARIFGWRV